MKTFVFAVMTSIVCTPEAHALFNHVAAEKSRREHAEREAEQTRQQLTQTQQQFGEQQRLAQDQQRFIGEQQQTVIEEGRRTNKWQTAAWVLGFVAVVMLIVGTAIGSRGRHYATAQK